MTNTIQAGGQKLSPPLPSSASNHKQIKATDLKGPQFIF